jgi:hypothetical protein
MLDQKLAEAMQRVLSKGEDRLALTGALQTIGGRRHRDQAWEVCLFQ